MPSVTVGRIRAMRLLVHVPAPLPAGHRPRFTFLQFSFPSRRRHTRLQGDWSSDVCSSDLIGRGRCSERLAGSEAYLPMLEALDSLQRNEKHGSLARVIRALAPSWYVQIMPPSQNDSSAARLAADTALGSQERLKREIAAFLEEVTRMHPVVLCFDDVHWADPSTTDLIGYLSHRIDEMRLLIVVTCRPSDLAQAKHPFLPLKLDLVSRGACREIVPGHLEDRKSVV